MISGLNWLILIKFCRNSSFTRRVGLIIASSRSGASFSSCLASSIYFSITKTCIFLRYCFLFVSLSPDVHPSQPISGPCSKKSIPPREWRIAIPASLMRVDYFLANRIAKNYQKGNVVIWGGWASSRLIHGFSDCVNLRGNVLGLLGS